MHTGQTKGNVTKWGGIKPPDYFFGIGFEAGTHTFVLKIYKLQNAKGRKSYYQLGKIQWPSFYQ